jgi:hypothetical protein
MQQTMPGTATAYHSAESAAEPSFAATSSSNKASCSTLQDAAAALAAAPASPSGAASSPEAAARIGSAESTLESVQQPIAGTINQTAQAPGSSSSKVGIRRSLDWSPVVAGDSALQPAETLSRKVAGRQLQQQVELARLPSAALACYSDALSRFCSPAAAQGAHHQQQQPHKIVWRQELIPEAPAACTSSSGKGSASTHSCSTTYHSAGSQ